MTAYVISETEALDEAEAQRYRELAGPSVVRYGGRYLARGASPEVAEGEFPAAQRVVIIEFPSMARLQEWYASPEYAEALEIRRHAIDRRLLFVEGL